MANDTGLPDYVLDYFDFMVRSSVRVRVGQVIFFVLGLLMPVVLILQLPDAYGESFFSNLIPLIVTGSAFIIATIWYLSWMEIRRHRFKDQRPSSYNRWYGHKLKPLGASDPVGQFVLIRLQLRHVFLGIEPSATETLALTMRFVRNNA
jgi:hypothetical protein